MLLLSRNSLRTINTDMVIIGMVMVGSMLMLMCWVNSTAVFLRFDGDVFWLDIRLGLFGFLLKKRLLGKR